ncbi:polyprenyl synthetase family protein [Candidatus Xenohaliotis californiensis]
MSNKHKPQTIDQIRLLINEHLNKLWTIYSTNYKSQLMQAAHYSLMSKGKRIRGALLIGCANIFNANWEHSLLAASAIEMAHAYSLIHDDLPAMDNADMRRGQPSCHKKFGEAAAILAGNTLLSLSFELLSSYMLAIPYKKKCMIIHKLSKSLGFHGMTGGQMLDIMNKNKHIGIDKRTKINKMKTGQLFIAACEIGAMLGNAGNEEIALIKEYATNIGIAFQIIDDIHDNQDKSKHTEQSDLAIELLKNASGIIKKLRNNNNILLHNITKHITLSLPA